MALEEESNRKEAAFERRRDKLENEEELTEDEDKKKMEIEDSLVNVHPKFMKQIMKEKKEARR